jgi:GT2 family glycosyltransferase
MTAARRLDWALCVPTLDRIDVLEAAVRCALAQTRPPAEIAVVDASPHWCAHRERIAAITEGSGVRLHYEAAPAKSSAVQRNTALARVGADVVFFFDDDTLMHPGCAAALLEVYEGDAAGRIAAAAASHVVQVPAAAWPDSGAGSSGEACGTEEPPAGAAETAPGASVQVARKGLWSRVRRRVRDARKRSRLVGWFMGEVMMMARNRLFVPYDAHRPRAAAPVDQGALGPGVSIVRHLPGFSMTVRRTVAEAEPFNPWLLAYCPTEDLDASYRWGRSGLCVQVRTAQVHHYEAASGRVTRGEATLLGLLNSAFFTRLNSDAPWRHGAHYYVLTLRRVLGEFLKDLLNLRLTFPQARAALEALPRSVAVFRHPREGLGPWYHDLQQRILDRRRRRA